MNTHSYLSIPAILGLALCLIFPFGSRAQVADVAAGHSHSLIRMADDNSLWAVGGNVYGQLGKSDNDNRNAPVQIDGGVRLYAAGGYHSLFVKSADGTLWGMGKNIYGQLGDGSATDRSTPVQINISVGYIDGIAAGYDHSLFIDGSNLFSMGRNEYGQLGDGSTTDRSTPVLVDGNVSSVEAGANHSLYVKTDGSLWAMGRNAEGQLGDGTNDDKVIPIEPKPFYLDLQAGPGGTVLGSGNFGIYETATLSAVPQTGYFFDGWNGGDYSSTGNPAIVTMDGARTIAAQFTNLSSHTNALEEIARTDGNASGISYVQNNPSIYNLFTLSEKQSAESAASAQSLATVQANLAEQGLSLLTYFDQVNANLPHTHNWYYQPGMGWLWTQANTFPFVYRAASGDQAGGWLYFSQLADQPNPSFYDYATEIWLTPSIAD